MRKDLQKINSVKKGMASSHLKLIFATGLEKSSLGESLYSFSSNIFRSLFTVQKKMPLVTEFFHR